MYDAYCMTSFSQCEITIVQSLKLVVGFSFFFPVEGMQHRPVLTRPAVNTTVMVGGTARFYCEVLSSAHKHQEWHRGYHTSLLRVDGDSKIEIEAKVGVQFGLHAHNKSSNLSQLFF